jgi:hypothetical protein
MALLKTKRAEQQEQPSSEEPFEPGALSEVEIVAKLVAARQRFEELRRPKDKRRSALDAARVELERVHTQIISLQGALELKRGAQPPNFRDLPVEQKRAIREAEKETERRQASQEPLLFALHFVGRREHRTLRDRKLRLSVLLDENGEPNESGKELVQLVTTIRRYGFGVEGAEPLSDQELRRYEQLVSLAASSSENVYELARAEAAAMDHAMELASEITRPTLEQRPLLAEAGCVQLPRRVVHDWLTGDEGKTGAWCVIDLAMLTVVLAAFENKDPSFFQDARFEEEDGEPVLVVEGGLGTSIQMHGQIAGSPADAKGFVRPRQALAALHRNRFLTIAETAGAMRIRLGPQAKVLLKGRAA